MYNFLSPLGANAYVICFSMQETNYTPDNPHDNPQKTSCPEITDAFNWHWCSQDKDVHWLESLHSTHI